MKHSPSPLRWGLATLVVVIVAVAVSLATAGPSSKEVVLRAVDGVGIAATYYPPKSPGQKPSVILLHMLNRTRSDWADFALALAQTDYAVLAIDLRGHGESTREVGSWREFTPADFRAMVRDVEAAHEYLQDTPEADSERLAVIGASIGANVALLYGSRDPSVKTLVLLSPGLDYRGVTTAEAMKTYGGRPVLIAASREDAYSAQSSSTLDSLARGRHRLILYNGAGHGTRMFRKVPELKTTLLEWLGSTL
ncbi:MAG: alpha/beta fold hydrolase [Nitrospinae bacterium]|nr:alpha/beta fold hydrolase [Nitrospinota bacterium]